MNMVSGRIRLGRSAAAVAAGAFLLALVPVSAAHAAGPGQFRGSEPVSFTDTTTCGFPIAVNGQDTFVGREFFDAQGNLQSIDLEQNTVGTESANGISLSASAHYVEFLDVSTGGATEVGLSLHIQIGTVVGAGYLAINPDGSVAVVHGTPVLEGDTGALCAELS